MIDSMPRGYREPSSLLLVRGPNALRLFVRILYFALGATLLALFIVPWQPNVPAAGRVSALDPFDRIQTVAAPVSGRVLKAWVIEGTRVKEGDRLLEIVDLDPEMIPRLAQQRQALESQLAAGREKVRVYQMQVEALTRAQDLARQAAENLVEVAGANVRSAQHGVEAAEAAVAQAQLNFERQKQLVDEGLASTLEFEVAELIIKQAKAELSQDRQALTASIEEEKARRADLGRVQTEAQARIESARAEEQGAEAEAAGKDQELATLSVRIAQQNAQLITAPRSGTVFRLYASPGAELVKAGTGLEIPLLKDVYVDAARTNLRASEIRRRGAEPRIEVRRLEIVRQASDAYWNWIAMGLNVDVERHLLGAAEDRRSQLEGRAARGALDAAVTLSLFFRDENGEMSIPDHARLPRDFPVEAFWDDDRLQADIERASARHPILRDLELRREGLLATLALNRNALLPDLRVGVEGSQDLGKSSAGIDSIGSFSNNPKDDTEVKATVRFEVPALQRGARGRVTINRVELIRLEQETRYARDAIEAEIRRAMAALHAAFDQTRLARKNYELSAQLQRAEERKFELGSSDLIDVNIREIQTADAGRALVFAQAAFFRAIARYEAATAGGSGGR